jgi:TPR repeat protein
MSSIKNNITSIKLSEVVRQGNSAKYVRSNTWQMDEQATSPRATKRRRLNDDVGVEVQPAGYSARGSGHQEQLSANDIEDLKNARTFLREENHFEARHAFNTFKTLAEKGNSEAQFYLGKCFYTGFYVLQNFTEAVEWFTKSALQGFSKSQHYLGHCFYDGTGVEKSFTKAMEWYKKSSLRKNPRAQFNLAQCFDEIKNEDEAFTWYLASAENGNSLALFYVGKHYEKGISVPKNSVKAAKWYKKSMEKGEPRAFTAMGYFYETGQGGFGMDLKMAVALYTEAANAGESHGIFSLGKCFYEGVGVEQDVEKAVELFRESAVLGNSWGQYFLGNCFYKGEGVEKNLAKAAELFISSADQGLGCAQCTLAQCFLLGHGVPRNIWKVAELLAKAVIQKEASFLNYMQLDGRKLSPSMAIAELRLNNIILTQKWPSSFPRLEIQCQNAVVNIFCIFMYCLGEIQPELYLPLELVEIVVLQLILVWPLEHQYFNPVYFYFKL